MFGKILSTVIKTATLPLDAATAAMDIACGGNGSKSSRQSDIHNPLSDLERLRDNVADAAREVDE